MCNKGKIDPIKSALQTAHFLIKTLNLFPSVADWILQPMGIRVEHSGYETLFMCQVAEDKSDLGRLMELLLTLP